MTAAAADPVNFNKSRRDNADMMTLPLVNIFFDDAPAARFSQPTAKGADRIARQSRRKRRWLRQTRYSSLCASGPKSPTGDVHDYQQNTRDDVLHARFRRCFGG
jgi:hypothetical protein